MPKNNGNFKNKRTVPFIGAIEQKIMILIDSVLLDEQVIDTPFLCNTDVCKGACCTLKGGTGAPLLDEEVPLVNAAIAVATKYLPDYAVKEIQQYGAVEGEKGEFTTRCINDRDCVFVYYEGKTAKCAIERAHFDGKTPFRKPISCHLYPIRIADFSGDYAYYDKISECKSALENGKAKNVPMYVMLREPLIRAYGEEWFEKLCKAAERRNKKII